MRIDLSGRTVLITGASRGIGAAIARAFGHAGARVAVHFGRSAEAAERLVADIGGGAEAFGADLDRPLEAERLWREVREGFGRIDLLVNNAGIALALPLDQPTERWIEDFDATLAVNLTASAVLCREAVRDFAAQGGGRIVNIASRAAFRGDTPEYMAYAASKAGLVALTRSIARGFGKQGIAAFVVAPGFTRTEMAQDFIDRYGEAFAVSDLALSRLTEPEDIAPTVVFLASGLADHATGSVIDINAGSYVR